MQFSMNKDISDNGLLRNKIKLEVIRFCLSKVYESYNCLSDQK